MIIYSNSKSSFYSSESIENYAASQMLGLMLENLDTILQLTIMRFKQNKGQLFSLGLFVKIFLSPRLVIYVVNVVKINHVTDKTWTLLLII